jgi:dTDP-4-dehydrorhamnose reductase
LIHISTDYVYGGDQKGAYLEDDPVLPLGVYAQSKAAGDKAVYGLLMEHIILRTAWVYGVHGHNFVKTMLRLGKEREQLSVVDDQTGCPTDAADLADAILDIAQQILQRNDFPWGIYHFCGGGQTTWYGFAREIFKLAEPYESFSVNSVEPVPTSAYPTSARRPANSVLDCSKITRVFDIVPRPWEESLGDMLRRYYQKLE